MLMTPICCSKSDSTMFRRLRTVARYSLLARTSSEVRFAGIMPSFLAAFSTIPWLRTTAACDVSISALFQGIDSW
ncbi:MAG: hypothetical protein BWY99_02619 [Synergistetes bacterium ADurb.BinA166]|nr:MAG: hypothetical protein BWY99_02619 [Synergistetes bacterium ADurb.BinA166]